MATESKWQKDLIQETLALWQERYPDALSEDDAQQIITNTTAFFDLLSKWDHDDSPRAEENNGGSTCRFIGPTTLRN
jgi:hypothetical protein